MFETAHSDKSRDFLKKAADVKPSYGLTFQHWVQLHSDQLDPDTVFLDCSGESNRQNSFDGMVKFLGSQAETET